MLRQHCFWTLSLRVILIDGFSKADCTPLCGWASFYQWGPGLNKRQGGKLRHIILYLLWPSNWGLNHQLPWFLGVHTWTELAPPILLTLHWCYSVAKSCQFFETLWTAACQASSSHISTLKLNLFPNLHLIDSQFVKNLPAVIIVWANSSQQISCWFCFSREP